MTRSFCLGMLICLSVTGGLLAAEPESKRVALVVGVRKYNHRDLSELRYSEADATRLAETLKSLGFQVILMTSVTGQKDAALQPLAANILRQADSLVKGLTKDDLALVALTGHGIQPQGASEAYFCPQDANPTLATGIRGPAVPEAPSTLIGIDTLVKKIHNSGVGNTLLLVDACRNAPLSKGAKGVESIVFNMPEQAGLLLSCSKGEFSFEIPELGDSGSGVFFHYVIEGLKGGAADPQSGVLTWDGLTNYVKIRVPDKVKEKLGSLGGRQTPSSIGHLEGTITLAKLTPTSDSSPMPTPAMATDNGVFPNVKLPKPAMSLSTEPGVVKTLEGIQGYGGVVDNPNISLFFSADGKSVFAVPRTNSYYYIALGWDVSNGRLWKGPWNHVGGTIAPLPDRMQFAISDSSKGEVRIANLKTGQISPGIKRAEHGPIAWSKDGKLLVVGGYSSGAISVIDGRGVSKHQYDLGKQVQAVEFDPTGKKILFASDVKLMEWDYEEDTVRELASLDTRIVQLLSHSASANLFVVAANGQGPVQASIRKLENGEEVYSEIFGNAVVSHAISNDWRRLLTGEADGSVVVWDVPTAEEVETIKIADAPIHAVAISPSGTVAVAHPKGSRSASVLQLSAHENTLNIDEATSAKSSATISNPTPQRSSPASNSKGKTSNLAR